MHVIIILCYIFLLCIFSSEWPFSFLFLGFPLKLNWELMLIKMSIYNKTKKIETSKFLYMKSVDPLHPELGRIYIKRRCGTKN